MAVNPRDNGDRIKDAAQQHSRGVGNDLYEGRTTDEDLAESDGLCLGEREEWNLAKVMRRGKWEAGPED